MEESLKFELFRHILNSKNKKEFERRMKLDEDNIIDSDFTIGNLTDHSSLKFDEEERKIFYHSYLLEKEYQNDITRKKNYSRLHQKKVKEFIDLYIQNSIGNAETEKNIKKLGKNMK